MAVYAVIVGLTLQNKLKRLAESSGRSVEELLVEAAEDRLREVDSYPQYEHLRSKRFRFGNGRAPHG